MKRYRTVTAESPPDTPTFNFYYTVPPNVVVHPPDTSDNSQDEDNCGTTNAVAPTVTATGNAADTTVASLATGKYPSQPCDANSLLLVCLGQMQIHMLQSMQDALGNAKKILPAHPAAVQPVIYWIYD
jgi:hypothetical protein